MAFRSNISATLESRLPSEADIASYVNNSSAYKHFTE